MMLLQHSMLLFGEFQMTHLPQADIDEARSQLQAYSLGLVSRHIPCRNLSRLITQLPEEVTTLRCGIESISAFQFQIFMKIFRALTRSGSRLAE
jgi:hypothetical protein